MNAYAPAFVPGATEHYNLVTTIVSYMRTCRHAQQTKWQLISREEELPKLHHWYVYLADVLDQNVYTPKSTNCVCDYYQGE